MKKSILTGALLLVFSGFSFAQFNYAVSSAQNVAGTYVDLGANGTQISTNYLGNPMGNDDDVSSLQNIGFNFGFNGQTFNKFYLNSNGFIKLANVGSVAPPEFASDILQLSDSNLLAPFNMDLIGGLSPEFKVFSSGTAGSRVCVIQFKNMVELATNSQYAGINFQIKLYETSNNIEFIYGTFSSNGSSPNINETVVGIKGNTDAASVMVTKFSDSLWSKASFLEGPYPGNKLNNKNTVLPDAGRTFRFVPITLLNNDASVEAVYTLGEIPINYGFPHVVKALIKNNGVNTLNNLLVSLSISGDNSFSNSQTISSLASGASTTVTFLSFTATTLGANTVQVSVPSDDNNANNSSAINQTIGNTIFSYADNSAVFDKRGVGTNSGTILVKYRTSANAIVSQVKVHISSDTANKGKTVYAVIANQSGTIVGSSLSVVLTAGDLNAYKTFDILNPTSDTIPANSDFYVGLAQLAQPGDLLGYSPVSVQRESSPARSGAYYSGLLTGGIPTEVTDANRLMIQALVISGSTPVNLYSFTANNNGKVNDLKWKVGVESNLDRYEVERSSNAVNFSSIGTVKASAASIYLFTDPAPGSGNNYYRIKMVDNDGSYKYSDIRLVKNIANASLHIYPNPVKSILNAVHLSDKTSEKQIVIIGTDGKIILRKNQLFNKGSNTIHFSVEKIPTGMYRLLVIDESSKMQQSFIKE